MVLAGRGCTPVVAAWGVAADRRRGAAAAAAGSQRTVRRPVRQPEPGRWSAPLDGQGRLLRSQGVPESRPDCRLLRSSYTAGMKPDYDVLIIGSGFCGSVSALRLTEKGEPGSVFDV